MRTWWAWLFAVLANTVDTKPGTLYRTNSYKTYYIEQPVSIMLYLPDDIVL